MQEYRGRILCVDDDIDTCNMMAALLGLEGYEVVQAQTVADGLVLAVGDNFDLILLDWIFADGTGIELCQMIRATGTRSPILFYSGMTLKSDMENAISAGAQGFMLKPVDPEELLQTVAQFVGSGRRRSNSPN